jgi:hypothetical protein
MAVTVAALVAVIFVVWLMRQSSFSHPQQQQ